jgi:lactate racemase
MKVALAYGAGKLTVELPPVEVVVIEPKDQPGLADEKAAVFAALDRPINEPPLSNWLRKDSRICIVFTDITRATPNQRLIPWLLEYLHQHGGQREQITLLNSTGTHRPNTRAELAGLLTAEVVSRYRVVNHDCEDAATLVQLGVTNSGAPALLNRHLVEADVRIVTGFIEPHFFAGFSGGVKGIMPGVAGLRTIMSNHGYRNLADPLATFGVTKGNPLWEDLRDIALRVGRSFLLNVTLNEQRQITGVFAGHLIDAHQAGIETVQRSAMQKVDAPFDVVISSNSGSPLDLNLYQGVKGLSAAARIAKHGGTIILAAECREGYPSDSPFERLLRSANSPGEMLEKLRHQREPLPEQWQAQILANIQQRARVLLHSAMNDDDIRAAHLIPCHDIGAEISLIGAQHRSPVRIGVLPLGPLTIPFLVQPAHGTA